MDRSLRTFINETAKSDRYRILELTGCDDPKLPVQDFIWALEREGMHLVVMNKVAFTDSWNRTIEGEFN